MALGAATAASAAAWEGSVTIATGAGEKGPWQQNDSRYDYVDDPTVAFAPDGGLALAWVRQRDKDVFFRGPDGKPVNVSRTPETFSWLPRIAFAPHDGRRVHVLWQEIIFSGGSHGGDILFAHSEDGGTTFSAPLNLSNSPAGDGKGRISRDVWDNGSLDLAVGADGAVYATWTDYEGSLYLSVSADGRTFSTPRVVAGSPGRPARAPSLAAGPDRVLYLAWTHGEDAAADVRVARSIDGGARFGEPVVIGPGPAFSDAPKIVLDRRGMLHLAYAEADRVFYARSADSARSFEVPRAVSGNKAGFPSIGVDLDGNVLIIWEALDGRRPIGLGFCVSRNGGGSFSAPGPVPGSAAPAGAANGSQQGLLARKLAVAANGAAAVVSSTLERGARSRVWLLRGTL